MSKTWYPVINYEKCNECGACIEKCTHGVFKEEGTRPVVAYPAGCVQGCNGCGNRCPEGAIEYVGEKGNSSESSCGCCCQ